MKRNFYVLFSWVLLLLTCCKKKLIQELAQDIFVSMDVDEEQNIPKEEDEKENDTTYTFRDNAWEWKLYRTPFPCRGREEDYTKLKIGLVYCENMVSLVIRDIPPNTVGIPHKWLIEYSRSNALGPLEDNDCMERLFGMLVEEQNHSAIAQDLLENTNLVLCEEKQRIAALILESIVSLLRTEIQQGFRAYLRTIKENKATFSRDAMNNFLNNSITPNQRKYRFGDNVEAIYGRWSYENKEYMKITSRGGIRVNVKHSHYAPYIKQLAQSGDYRTLIEELRTTRKRISSSDITKTVDDSLIATDLLDNTDYSLSIITQQDAASVLEAIVGLAEEWRKQGAAKLFRGYLRAVQAGRTDLSIENMRKHFKFAYDATSAREEYRKRTSGPQLGRKQVARARRAKADPIALDKLEQYDSAEHLVYGYLSDDEEGDYNSEDELRERKGSEVITKRNEETGEEKEVKIKRKVDLRDDELFQDKKSE